MIDDTDDTDDDTKFCSPSKFKTSMIPKRKKSFKFKKLHEMVDQLSDCSKRCCKIDDCLLSFTVEKKCYGVMCSDDGSCHTKKDMLPRAKISVTYVETKETEGGYGNESTIFVI